MPETRECQSCGAPFTVPHPSRTRAHCAYCRPYASAATLHERQGHNDDVPNPTADPGFKRWSKDAIFCFYAKADCDICPIFKFYQRHKDNLIKGKCYMPESVEKLIALNIPMPLNSDSENIRKEVEALTSARDEKAL